MDVDVAVIGSGAGGLTAAVALARAGKRVAVFEQHTLPGGWCHSFTLEGHSFSPGVHYIGELGTGGSYRRVLEGLGLADKIAFTELDRTGYDRVHLNGREIPFPAGKRAQLDALSNAFPSQRKGFKALLDLFETLSQELKIAESLSGASWLKAPFLLPNVIRHGGTPLSKTLRAHLDDPAAMAVLTALSGDYAVHPDKAATALHAAVAAHYFDGGAYPVGGARALPKAFIKELRAHGGTIRVGCGVSQILTEGRKVLGVRLDDGTEVRAKHVISNADPATTFGRLLPEDAVPRRLRRKLRKTTWSTAAMSLFLAVDRPPEAFGSANRWMLGEGTPEAAYRWVDDTRADGPCPSLFLTCPSAKDPDKYRGGPVTLEAFSFLHADTFKAWEHTEFGARSPSYEARKQEIVAKMYDRLEEVFPNLRSDVVFESTASPLTNAHYLRAHKGSLYGTEKTLRQLGLSAWPIKTPIEGLFCCGASTLSHGVAGATFSGVVAAKTLLGCSSSDLFTGRGTLEVRPALEQRESRKVA